MHNTDVDFIVFRRQGEAAPAEPLLALAREANAFAVARQLAYSGWREKVVTKHPFRKLQPGEVSDAFAPYSSLIAIRRDVLARFGVPHVLTYGAALMILSWKAAAAGMRSLVLGHDGAITPEPAMALGAPSWWFAWPHPRSAQHGPGLSAPLPRQCGFLSRASARVSRWETPRPGSLAVPALPLLTAARFVCTTCAAPCGVEVDFVLACSAKPARRFAMTNCMRSSERFTWWMRTRRNSWTTACQIR